MKLRYVFTLCAVIATAAPLRAQPQIELVQPFQAEHVHGSYITELPGGELLVAWFQGTGERQADDVRILGARKKPGGSWSDPFVLADTPGFPDINPVVFVDPGGRLWLMWYTVLAGQWDTSLLKYRISEDYTAPGPPKWAWQDVLLVRFEDAGYGISPADRFVSSVRRQLERYDRLTFPSEVSALYNDWKASTLDRAAGADMRREGRIYGTDGSYRDTLLGYPLGRRIGWQTRNKPVFTPSGRMIVPLYSDGFSFSLMAYSDDHGATWGFSEPLVGPGNIQPAIARTSRGELVAYMRDNGPPPKRLHVSRSADDGETWSPVEDSDLPNPGSGADILTLRNGNWVLVYNDTESGRHSLAVSLSDDDGRTWKWTKHLEQTPNTRAHYPAVIEGRDGTIHVSYSFFHREGDREMKTIKHAAFPEAWLREP